MKFNSLHPSVLAAALSLTGLTPTAHALNFVLRDASTSGAMTAQQLSGFQAAANFWSSKLSDQVTVYVDIAFNSLGTNILGSTNSSHVIESYTSVRDHLASHVTSALDASAVANLQPGSALTFMATQGDLSSRLDNDGSSNNTQMVLTTANAKALGIATSTSAQTPDAKVTFATGYASTFSYTRAGGVPSDKTDFITVAEHEIGHALGFASGVDIVDYCAGPNNKCGMTDTANRFENYALYDPLDLFRYSAPGVLDLRVDGSPYFSVDGGASSIETFSTGAFHGNKWQASHFGTTDVNLMRPYIGPGESYDATSRDLAAFDAIGWNVGAVPEPQTYALLLAGLGAIGFAKRRRDLTQRRVA